MKCIITIPFVLFANTVFAQISIVPTIKKENKIETYDSLRNICYDNIRQQKGQMLLSVGSFLTEDGYTCFSNTPTFDILPRNQYKQVRIQTDYGDRYVTGKEYIQSKYFKVDDILEKKIITSSVFCLKLIEQESFDTLYFITNSSAENERIFINTGYYEKMKSLLTNKTYYSNGNSWHLTKIENGQEISPRFKDVFKCTDLVVELGDNSLYAKLESNQYGSVKVKISSNKIIDGFIEKSLYDKCVEKYGFKWGNLVAQNRVQTGMTAQMVIDAWGRPDETNIITGEYGDHEQWVYRRDNSYLYFENGKLTTMQR